VRHLPTFLRTCLSVYPKTGFFETSVIMLKRKMMSLPKSGKINSVRPAIRTSRPTVLTHGPVGCCVYVILKSLMLTCRRHSVQNLLSSSLLSKILEIKIYRTLILPVVLCGCETWSLTLR